MRLEECVLDVNMSVSAPLQRGEPEEDWVQARDSQLIPLQLFSLYARANYLSFGSAPPFFHDKESILFAYLSMILRSIKESLVEAEEQLQLFVQTEGQGYDPGKKLRGETWDKTAHQRARRHFKSLLISLQSGLDAVAILLRYSFLV